MKLPLKLIRKICSDYNVKVHDIARYKDQSKIGNGSNYECSWQAGREVFLGIYKDDRFKFISHSPAKQLSKAHQV